MYLVGYDLGRLLAKFLAWCATYKSAWVSSNVSKRFKHPRASFSASAQQEGNEVESLGHKYPRISGFFLTNDVGWGGRRLEGVD